MNQLPLYIYDLETYKHLFSFAGKWYGTDEYHVFEISRRRNDRTELLQWLEYLKNMQAYMVGYNNVGFDYPILHELLVNPYTFDTNKAYQLGQQIIRGGDYGFTSIKPSDRIIPQIDLAKINHFDNKMRRTSLKSLQFAMRSPSVEDLPYDVDAELTDQMMTDIISYNIHDVGETGSFTTHCLPLIELRQQLIDNGVLRGDVLNFSDTKIGEQYLVNRIGRQKCYSGSRPKQTFRNSVSFKDIILPSVAFKYDQYQEVLEWFKSQTIWINRKDTKPKLSKKLAGIKFEFALGGVHASVESKVYESSDTHIIKDIDVAGMYPSIAIANGFAPEHLGDDFKLHYKAIKEDRKNYPKGTSMNAMLKLAGNGVYGKSNDPYSCFYDPQYTYATTVNGQLQLLQLVESLDTIPGLEVIQANTDGVTVYLPREYTNYFNMWCREWEKLTGLELEEVDYQKMWIRDVNNYLVLRMDGKIKAKGAYWYPKTWKDYEGYWNKDYSQMAVQKGIEQVLVNGYRPESVIRCITDPFDFMLRFKTTGGSKCYIGDKVQSKTCRYYVSTAGEPMKVIRLPKGPVGQYKKKNKLKPGYYEEVMAEIGLDVWDERIHSKNKSKYKETTTTIKKGFLVKNCNNASDFNWSDVDFDYYAAEIRKLHV